MVSLEIPRNITGRTVSDLNCDTLSLVEFAQNMKVPKIACWIQMVNLAQNKNAIRNSRTKIICANFSMEKYVHNYGYVPEFP